jgi:predicted PurR-regulated permease PerM
MNNQLPVWQKAAYGLFFLSILVYAVIIGKPLFEPMVFSILLTLILSPLVRSFEGIFKRSIPAIAVTFIIVVFPFLFLFGLFSWYSVEIFSELPSINKELDQAIREGLSWFENQTGMTIVDDEAWLKENISKITAGVFDFLGEGVSSTTASIASFFLTLVYTALLLYYRKTYHRFAVMQFPGQRQGSIRETIKRMQTMLQRYCYGMLSVIGILAVLNTLGLWVIGINYAPFWGCLAAFLAIIPYIGTTLGGFLPFVFALATTGTYWQPIAVVAYYLVLQQIEGNLITPNIVGGRISVNPLVVIFGMVVGGLIWGISGLIITLPIIALIRVICEEVDVLKPVAVLLSSSIRKEADRLDGELNKDKHRLFF